MIDICKGYRWTVDIVANLPRPFDLELVGEAIGVITPWYWPL